MLYFIFVSKPNRLTDVFWHFIRKKNHKKAKQPSKPECLFDFWRLHLHLSLRQMLLCKETYTLSVTHQDSQLRQKQTHAARNELQGHTSFSLRARDTETVEVWEVCVDKDKESGIVGTETSGPRGKCWRNFGQMRGYDEYLPRDLVSGRTVWPCITEAHLGIGI